MLTGGDGGQPGEGLLPLGGASPTSDSHIQHVDLSLISSELYVAYSYLWLHSGALPGALDLTFCINLVVPRVMPFVLCGLQIAQMVMSVSKPRHRHD